MAKELWKRYQRTSEKILLKVKEHELPFEVGWLKSIVEWVADKKFVTPQQMAAVDNAEAAVANMIRYRRLRRKSKETR